MTRDDEKFLNDLLTKTVNAKKPQIKSEVKCIPTKIEQPKLKYEDVVIKKDLLDVKLHIKTDIFLPDVEPDIKQVIFLHDVKLDIKTDIFLPDVKTDIKPDVFLPDYLDTQIEIFVDNNNQSWVDHFPDIKPNVFLTTTDDNLDAQTETFVDNNYQSWVDDLPDIKPDKKKQILR